MAKNTLIIDADEKKFSFFSIPYFNEKYSKMTVSVPFEEGMKRNLKGKKLKVTVEVVDE